SPSGASSSAPATGTRSAGILRRSMGGGPHPRLLDAIQSIDAAVGHPHPGRLPLELFLLASRLVPLFTVDLWIQWKDGAVLLTWRDDAHFGRGWHVPGSALRFGETAAHRLRECA